ncbi:hypothetical protein BC940DRAFT_312909 [Gongronella butleri]|nr:hypothetical protein BC940DRAFT_312909 [Gongronella butleri]
MPPKPVIETTASSIVDLKAQLLEHRRHSPFKRKETSKKLRLKRSDEASSKQDYGHASSSASEIDNSNEMLVQSRASLQKKAKLYDALAHMPFDEDHPDILVDFEQKQPQADQSFKQLADAGEWVEIEDEFGRTRVVRKDTLATQHNHDAPQSPVVPNYEGFASRAHIRHYDSSKENRTVGVGHYTFATDEEERVTQMNELKALRQQTESARLRARTSSERRKAIIATRAEFLYTRQSQIRRQYDRPQQVNDQVTDFLQQFG